MPARVGVFTEAVVWVPTLAAMSARGGSSCTLALAVSHSPDYVIISTVCLASHWGVCPTGTGAPVNCGPVSPQPSTLPVQLSLNLVLIWWLSGWFSAPGGMGRTGQAEISGAYQGLGSIPPSAVRRELCSPWFGLRGRGGLLVRMSKQHRSFLLAWAAAESRRIYRPLEIF